MSERLTHAEFSRLASILAHKASGWAFDCLTLPEEFNEPMLDHSVDRFLDEMRRMVEYIGERAGRAALGEKEGSLEREKARQP